MTSKLGTILDLMEELGCGEKYARELKRASGVPMRCHKWPIAHTISWLAEHPCWAPCARAVARGKR